MTEEKLREIVQREIHACDGAQFRPVCVAQKIADELGLLGLTNIVRIVVEERAARG